MKTIKDPVQVYNDKKFLLPDSINSCSLYHAKVFDNGNYLFRIHDCETSIRFRGELLTEIGRQEAHDKICALICGLIDFDKFIEDEYFNKEDENDGE